MPTAKEFDFSRFMVPWEKQGIYHGVPEEYYHDKVVAMSAGQLKTILDSPAHFQAACLKGRSEPTPAMRFGSLAHKAILEGPEFLERHIVMPEFGGKGSKAEKADWIEKHKSRIIVTEEELEDITGMLNSVLAHPVASKLLAGCGKRTEISGFFNLDGIRCKMRADIWRVDNLIVDLKTCQSAAELDFMKDAWSLRYPVQADWYTKGAEILTGQRHDFAYIAVEKKRPWPVAVYTAGAVFLSAGEQLTNLSLARFREAMNTGKFKAYSEQAQELQVPPWAMRELEEIQRVEQTLVA